jgi:hypothetical protein
MPHRGTYLNLLLRMSTLKSVCVLQFYMLELLDCRPCYIQKTSIHPVAVVRKRQEPDVRVPECPVWSLLKIISTEMPMMAVCHVSQDPRGVYYVGVG